MTRDTTVLPNKGNFWTLLVVFSPMTVVVPVIGFFDEGYSAADILFVFCFGFIGSIWAYLHTKAQRVVLADTMISHRYLGFSGFQTKFFKLDDIDYWKMDRLILVIVKKGYKAPKLPHGPFEELSGAILIPSTLFAPRTKVVTEYLSKMNIRKK